MKINKIFHIGIILLVSVFFISILHIGNENNDMVNNTCQTKLNRKLNISKHLSVDKKSEYERSAYDDYIRCIQE